MNPGYYNQPPYPPAPWPPQPALQQPAKPAKPWPLTAFTRWLTIGLVALTALAVLLALLAPLLTQKPSTAGQKLIYQSSLTHDDGKWDTNTTCTFSKDGYVVTAPNADNAAYCALKGQSLQNFTMSVRIVNSSNTAVIGFLSTDRLAIFNSGRFLFYQKDNPTATPRYLIPSSPPGTLSPASAGSLALHPSSVGVSNQTNVITIQVQDLTYSFYANGQLLASYNSPAQENPGTITLIALGGDQVTFSDISLYVPGSSS